MALTIRLTEEQESLLNKLQKTTGSPASKSLLIAASFYVNDKDKMNKRINVLEAERDNLKSQVEEIKRLLKLKSQLEQDLTKILK